MKWFTLLGLLSLNVLAATRELPNPTLKRLWDTAKANIYPKSKEAAFAESTYQTLAAKLSPEASPSEVASVLNPFLLGLEVSHTRLYTEDDPDYYFFRSLFSTRNPEEPKISHIGAQFTLTDQGHVVRTVLQGYPAAKAALRRGDLIVRVNGSPFHPVKSFLKNQQTYELEFLRGEIRHKKMLRPVHEALPHSFHQAIQNSVTTINKRGKTIGYVQLWTGVLGSENILSDIIQKELAHTDALILDLRDGFGGAWWDHLDPFFPDRGTYFQATMETRDGSRSVSTPEQRGNENHYSKPMVVLINEGVRSGKEALAYQFKKRNRAILIGTTTAGAFVTGRGYFSDENSGYILYLAVNGIALDQTRIEGLGIRPDLEVAYPLTSLEADPQLTEAIEVLSK